MMELFMLLVGVGVGAMLRDLIALHRGDVIKERQQLESKTPYDYALTNAINERDRHQDELRTILALKRTEADTERIRNEINTMLSDVGEEPTESVYDGKEATDEQFLRMVEWQKKDAENRHPAARAALGRERKHTPYKFYGIERLESGTVDISTLNSIDFGEHIPIKEHADGTFSPILFPYTGMSAAEAGWDAAAVSRAYARLGGNVREDVSKDERLSEESEERSLTKAVRDSFENKEVIRVTWRDSYGSLRFRRGAVDEIATGDGKVKEFGMRGLEIFAGDVIRIMKGDDGDGETLYRKGNR